MMRTTAASTCGFLSSSTCAHGHRVQGLGWVKHLGPGATHDAHHRRLYLRLLVLLRLRPWFTLSI